MADDTFIFIPKGAPYIDTGVSPSVTYQDGQIHAFDSAVSDELAAATRIQTGGAGFDVSTLLAAATGLSLGGQTKFAAGSAAAPSLTTTGDLDTGIYFPAANALGFALAGSAVGCWTTTGLGIGTASPTTALHVEGQVRGGNADNAWGYKSYGSSGALRGGLWNLSSGLEFVGASFNNRVSLNDSANSVKIRTAGLDRFLIDASGNVGIGTTSPGNTLHVNGGVRLSSLPTSAAGLSTGDIWNDSGTLKIA